MARSTPTSDLPSRRYLRLVAVVALVGAQLAVGGFVPAAQAAPGESCFTVSDGNDTLYRYNYDGGPFYETIGSVGVPAVEAISWDPTNSILYAMDAGQLGTLNQSTGAFSPIGADSGLDMDGLGLDPFTGVMYGAIRRADGQSGGSGVYDDLATINITTGAVTVLGPIAGAVDDTGDILYDVDDLAFDPTTGSLWGVANAGGNDTLITINKATGAVISSVGEFGVNDIEGLSWNDIGGLRGTTGSGGGSPNRLWDINPTTAAASNPISLSPGSDFESLGCYRLAGPLANTITGTVYLDANVDAVFDAGDTGTGGHTVDLYRDVNGDGMLTAADDVTFDGTLDSDDILATRTTDGSGFYSFTVGASGAFIVEVDASTLPGGSRLTTPGRRAVDFGTSWEQTDAGNDFGYSIPAIALSKATTTPLIDSGDTASYSYTLENTGTEPFPAANVGISDNACAPVTGPTGGDANANNVLDPGEIWAYSCSTALTEDTTNTATATVVPVAGANLVEQDTAFVDVRPTIVVTKAAGVASVPESGATVTFTVTVENTSAENVTLDSVTDSDFGDVLDGANPLITSTTCVGGTTVLPGPGNTYSCTFDAAVSGDASGPSHANTVTVGASDDDGNSTTDDGSDTVGFTDVLPTVVVTKTPGVASIPEPGGPVTFTIDVENTSAEEVDLTSLTDSEFGNLFTATASTCATTTIAAGATYSCSFQGSVAGSAAGPDHSNTVTVSVQDNEGNPAGDTDGATVAFTDVLPSLAVTKTAAPSVVPATGAPVVFTVRVDNTSVEPITLTSLSDSIYGDIADALNPAFTSTTCSLPQAIGVSGFYQCTFTAVVSGSPGGSELDTVTATAADDEGNTAMGSDDATVSFAAGSIGDFVWLDLNGDGVQDGGAEAGFGSITMELYADADGSGTLTAGDTLVDTTSTDAGGAYDFIGLAAGDYLVVPDTTGSLAAYDLTGGSDPTAVSLAAGEDYNAADFGYQPTGSVGDFVWLDLDGDGVQDGGAESGIAGVTVDLYVDADSSGTVSAGDTLVGTETTDGAGAYDFTGLVPGDYVVTVTDTGGVIPPSTLTGGSDPTAVSLAAGEDYNAADFGYQPLATVGDRVWHDVNGNGLQDPAEVDGLPGVTVRLIDPGPDTLPGTLDDVVVDTDTSDAAGAYLLTGPPGSYVVEFAGLPAGWILSPADQGGDDTADSDAAPATGFTALVPVPAGAAVATVDAGAFEPGRIGDRVFIDLDEDGVFDAGEGIPNITVTLSDGQTAVTDADGFYEFQAAAGSYTVAVDELDPDFPPAALQTVGTNPQPASITSGEVLDTVDFGYIIAGPGILLEKDPAAQTVLAGSDVDFTITVTNIGNVDLSGVAVTDTLVPACDSLVGDLARGASVSYGCTAASVGADFTNSATASGTPPIGPDVESTDTADVDVVSPAVTIAKDPDSQMVLTGTAATFTITVANAGDVALTNVAVTDPLAPDCDNPIGTLPVSASVTYSCTVIATVDFVNTATVDADGPLGPLAPVSDTAAVFVDEASLEGRVWLDLNGDAGQDAGEPGAGGVPVDLLDSSSLVVASTVTDGSGAYRFDGLGPDTYTVRVDAAALPAGTVATADPDGTLDDETSRTVALGDAVAGLDFGYQPPATVAGLLFYDDDGDAVREAGEAALAGVTVVVTDSAGTVFSVVTDAAGEFSTGVTPGPVTIDVDDATVPGGYTLTTANDPQTVIAVAGQIAAASDIGYQPAVIDLHLSKVSSEGNVQAGDDADWILTITNLGTVPAAGPITLTDDLPAGLTYVDAYGAGWTCSSAGSLVTCEHPGPLAPGAQLVVTITTEVADDLTGTLNNEAVVSLAGEVNVLNNTAVAGIGLLPNTGFNVTDALVVAMVSLLLGAALLGATRRRREDQDLVRKS
ncbi:MAG: DUF11 domain-containing protein [Acidimicrobiia bacterium]|nr:DUF11 domain-containing protein [Acidimicrobiia bacterium]